MANTLYSADREAYLEKSHHPLQFNIHKGHTVSGIIHTHCGTSSLFCGWSTKGDCIGEMFGQVTIQPPYR